jgi:hypothetical protein
VRALGGLAIVALVVCSADAAATFRTRRFVEQVSQDPFAGAAGSEADTQVEPHIAVDPSDPSIVVAVFQEGRFDGDGGAVDIGYATSHDGGATWTTGSLPGLTVAVGGAFERASDPAVAIARDGAVYAQSLVFNVSDCRSAVAVQRSDDGGLTFGSPVLVHEDCTVFNDKTWIGVDTSPTSPHYGRLYSAWDLSGAGAPIVLSHSDDRGATWSSLVTVNDASVTAGIGALPLVQPNGDVTVVYEAYNPGPAREVSQTSHDGGAHFDAPVTIGTFQGIGVADMRTGIGLPAAAVDGVTGDLYAVWPDGRFRLDGLNDIVLGRSTDGGVTWQPLSVVDQDATRRTNHFTPAVAADDGTVIVTYRSRREGSLRVDTRWAVSADGGVTFGRAHKLGRSTDVRFAATSGGDAFLGDYMGVALTGDAAHAVWCNATRPRVEETHHQTTWGATIVR